jgi:hypothetical protein
MGILDNIAARVAAQIVKASPAVGLDVALERPTDITSIPFAPGMPLIPSSINPLGERGKPDPRRWEYEVAQNINVTGGKLVPFKTLRQSSEQIDIIRRCIEVLKAKMAGLDWDIVLSETAVEAIMADQGVSQTRAAQIAKESYAEAMSKARTFWAVPDISNGMSFADWLNMALEDILVLDAFAVWPQKTYGGELRGLQILDGSTIKPLIDARGMKPEAPMAAFQQILYGFPRSEFSAPDETLEADGEFTSDELAYMVRNKRSHSVYGLSPVERSLSLADIYLRHQQWMRSEYTDGVLPELMFKTNSDFGSNPDLLRAYENIFNDDLSGQTEQRKRARLLPMGMDPVQFDGYDQKFSSALPEYVTTAICGHFGVLPTEIGFTGKTGLGGSSVHEGQAESSEVLGLIPLAQWVGRQLSQMSYVFLGMPRELEFKFQPSARQDDKSIADADDVRLRNGTMTINEARSKAGLSLLESDVADTPIMVAGAGAYLLTDEGPQPFDMSATSDMTLPTNVTNVMSNETVAPTEAPKAALPEDIQEMRAFVKWSKKSPSKAFKFNHVPEAYAETLNKFIEVGDHEGARWYASLYA